MSRLMTKPTKWHVRPAKTQIILGIRPVWSESSLCAQWVAKDPIFLHADSEDSDQTNRMPRLIWVFAGCTFYFVGFVMRRLILFHQLDFFRLFPIDLYRTLEASNFKTWWILYDHVSRANLRSQIILTIRNGVRLIASLSSEYDR